MEQYLRAYVNYQQDNWIPLLSLAEFAHNNTVTAPLNVSSFFANYGYNPKFLTAISPGKTKIPPTPESRKLVESLKTLHQSLVSEMAYVQVTQANYANASYLSEPRFEVGSQV